MGARTQSPGRALGTVDLERVSPGRPQVSLSLPVRTAVRTRRARRGGLVRSLRGIRAPSERPPRRRRGDPGNRSARQLGCAGVGPPLPASPRSTGQACVALRANGTTTSPSQPVERRCESTSSLGRRNLTHGLQGGPPPTATGASAPSAPGQRNSPHPSRLPRLKRGSCAPDVDRPYATPFAGVDPRPPPIEDLERQDGQELGPGRPETADPSDFVVLARAPGGVRCSRRS